MKQTVIIPFILLLTGALAPVARATDETRAKELQRERAKLQKVTDPVERAKIGVKISDILIEDVGDAVRKGNIADMQTQLAAYAETIENAHQELVDSGRNAAKKPSGFKELEIALRQQVRKLDK